MARITFLGAAAAALAALLSRQAHADEAPYALTYSAPAGCPGAAEFASEVATKVPDPSIARGAVLDAKIVAGEGGVAGELTVTSPSGVTGSRRVDGRTCRDVYGALVFIASVAINLGGHVDEPSAPPAPSPPPPPAPRPPPPPAPVSPPPAPRPVDVSIDIAGGFDTALASGPRPIGEIGFAVGDGSRRVLAPWGRLSVGAAWSRIELPPGGAELWLVQGRIEACPLLFAIASVRLRPCAALALGPLFARGLIADRPRSATSLWIAPAALVRLEWAPAARFFVSLEGGVTFPLERARYVLDADTTIHTLPVVSARAALGAGYRF